MSFCFGSTTLKVFLKKFGHVSTTGEAFLGVALLQKQRVIVILIGNLVGFTRSIEEMFSVDS